MNNPNFLHRGRCLICGSNQLEVKISQALIDPPIWAIFKHFYQDNVSPKDVEGVNFIVYRCSKCELYFVANVPTDNFDAKLNQNWSKAGATVSKRQQAQNVRYFADYGLEAEKVAVILDRKPYGIEVLEFGSGNGHWLLMAKAYGYNTTGVEIRDDRIAYAEKNGLSIVRSVEELKDKRFDFIRSDLVFEHLANPLEHLRKLAKYLKPDGFMRIGVPEGDDVYRMLASYNGTPTKLIGPFGHINCFTHQALVALAKEVGLEPIPVSKLRKLYLKVLWGNRDTKYLGEIIKAGYKQKKRCTLYLQHAQIK